MTTKVATSPAFEALLADLNTMAKAIDVNEELIKAGRAAEGHMQHGDELAKSEEAKKKEKEKEEEEERKKKEKEKNEGKEHMHKSFIIETEGGQKIEVQDASELLKALSGRFDSSESKIFGTLEGAVTLLKSQGSLFPSLSDKLVAQDKVIGEQADLIKSIKGDLDKLGAAPAGRRAVLTVAERVTASATDVMAKAGMPEGVTVDNFFAKALDMQKAGKITGVDISLAEAALNSGVPVPQSIVQRVLG